MFQSSDEGRVPGTEKRGGGLNARAVAHAVKRRPLTLLGVAILAAGVGSAVWFFLPLPKATAATIFHISAQAPVLLNSTIESRVEFGSYRQSQVALVKRRLTLSSVLKQPAVQNLDVVRKQTDTLVWLDGALQVESRTNSEFMRVSIEGNNPDELRTILEAVSKAYLADVDESDNGMRRRRLAKLEEANRAYRTELERFHKRIDTVALALGSKDGPTLAIMDSLLKDELRAAVRELSATRDHLQWAELDLAGENPPGAGAADEKGRLEVTLPGNLGKVRLAGAAVAVSPAQIEDEVRGTAGFRELEAEAIRAQQALTGTKALFRVGERPPAVVKAEEDVKAAEQKRDKYREELRPQIEAALRKRNELREQARLLSLRAAAGTIKRREELAKGKVADVQRDIAKANDYRLELENIKSLIGQNEKFSTRFADEITQITIELGAPPRVTPLEEPFVVPGIEGNRRLKYTLLAALGVLVVGFVTVVMWEHRSRRVTHTDDVTAALGIRLIGAIPSAGRGTGKGHESHPVLVEAIDATRTMLLNGTHDSDLRVLVVTSAVSGEGKTSLSGHLAISLARAGFRTLLIDGDLRAPTAQRVFEIPLSPGLCEFLEGEVGGAAATRPTGVPGLSVMTTGVWTLATRRALVGDGWRVAKERLKAEFDFVVVDTSPLLLVSDALLLAREADGVVVSVLMGVSQVALVDEAVTRLLTVRAKVIGVIANGVRTAAHEYAHGYGSKPTPALPAGTPETPAR